MHEEVIEFSTEVDELVDITERVEEVVERSGIKNGLCLVFNLGSTGAILINEWEEGLLEDFKEMLAKLTSKNQITIPKGIMVRLPDAQYFDVEYVEGRILLKPLKVYGTDLGEVRAKIKRLGLSEDCVDEAVRWARSR